MDGNFVSGGGVDGVDVPSLERLTYDLVLADGPGQWQVQHMELRESLSEPFELVVDLATEALDLPIEAVLGASAVLTMSRVSVARQVAGVVARVERRGIQTDRLHVRLRIVPAFALLEQRVCSRIYQELTVEQIVTDVLERGLADYGREFRFELDRVLLPRDYCVQYRESDLAFVMRLLQEEGISFFFEHDDAGETMVMVDGNRPLLPVETMDGLPISTVAEEPELHEVESMQAFDVVHALRSTATDIVDFDFLTPMALPRHTQPGVDARGRTREIYDHTQRRFAVDRTPTRAAHTLEADTNPGERWCGSSNVSGLAPGRVVEHDDGLRFVVTQVTHRGASDEDRLGADVALGSASERYGNEFQGVPVQTPLRPARVTPRPLVSGPETAIVTGPSGEEIHTDEHGRIKVHFHWDREGRYDEASSCWIRVAQTWAGSGWGGLFIPRVGMEVVVSFLEGNPDRPLVVGCVYNGDNPPPYGLPGDKTKSTIKSNSSLGGAGFNEFRFEDLAGSEQVFLHAQKDLDEIVLEDHTLQVGNDETIAVAVNQMLTVGNDQSEGIGMARTTTVGTEDSLTVGASQGIAVGVDRSVTVGGSDSLVAGAMVSVSAGGVITLSAGAEIVLQAGASVITLGPTGIVLAGPRISLN